MDYFDSPSAISGSFNSIFKVLFIFPSLYFYTIGLPILFSLGRDLSPLFGLQSQTTLLDLKDCTYCSACITNMGILPLCNIDAFQILYNYTKNCTKIQ